MILCQSQKKTELPKDTQQMLYVHKRLEDNKGHWQHIHGIRNKIKKGRTRSSEYPSTLLK